MNPDHGQGPDVANDPLAAWAAAAHEIAEQVGYPHADGIPETDPAGAQIWDDAYHEVDWGPGVSDTAGFRWAQADARRRRGQT